MKISQRMFDGVEMKDIQRRWVPWGYASSTTRGLETRSSQQGFRQLLPGWDYHGDSSGDTEERGNVF